MMMMITAADQHLLASVAASWRFLQSTGGDCQWQTSIC